jgi:P27 family predicted phage terminase small subunit
MTMGKPGPRPTPTRILELRGSWRAKKRPGEPQPGGVPQCPEWLSPEGKTAFEVVLRRLQTSQVATQADEEAIARYADLLVQYRKAADFVAKHGDVYVLRGKAGPNGEEGRPVGFKTYPQARRVLSLAAALLQLEREFGLTPSARTQFVDETRAVSASSQDFFNEVG